MTKKEAKQDVARVKIKAITITQGLLSTSGFFNKLTPDWEEK